MSALRSFYGYYFKRQIISKNPTLLVDMPKLHEKAIIRLDTDEIAMLLDYVEHGGENLTGQRLAYYEKTKIGILRFLLFFSEPESVYRSVSVWMFRMLILKIME